MKPAPFPPLSYLQLYVGGSPDDPLAIDDGRTGCGRRCFILTKTGRKLAHLVEAATGIRIEIPLAALERARPIERPRWTKIAQQVARHAGDDKKLRGLATQIRRSHP
jgi:hypothetical protein